MNPIFKVLWKTFFFFSIWVVTAYATNSQISKTPSVAANQTLAQKLQNTLDSTRKNSDAKGCSAAIVMPDETKWLGVSGMSDPTIGERIRPEMFFDIGSTGKIYLATLILQLVEEGRLTLEDPLRKWLLEYPNVDKNITVLQLLNHTSGIYDFVKHSRSPWQMAYKSTKIWTQEQILAGLIDKPYFSPGSGWHYSTTNYILLRMIIEKATGLKLSEQLQNRFLTPLNLDNTIIIDPLTPIPPGKIIANNWIGDVVDLAVKPQPWTTTSPHLIYATAEDSAKWIHLLYHEKKVLDQKILDQMLDFHSPTPNEPPLSGYGLGVMFIDSELAEQSFGVKRVRMWGHGGSTLGFRSIVMYLPDYGTTISVLINGNNDESLINIFVGLLKVVLDDFKKTS